MEEYIEKEALMAYPIRINHYDREHGKLDFLLGIESVMEYAENLPAADVVEVVHGEWLGTEVAYAWKCSACGGIMSLRANYCCYCGAKMDGKEDKDGK